MKKILSIFVLVLTLLFTTQAFASLTFTTNAITGTTASSIDLGASNALSLQTTGNGAINLGSGLLTSTGSATFSGTVKGLNLYEDNNANLAIGSVALSRTHPGNFNIAIGYGIMAGNTNLGTNNVVIGYESLGHNTDGDSNTVVGFQALNGNTIGYFNTAIGYQAGTNPGGGGSGVNVTGDTNTYLGTQTGANSATQRTNTTTVGYRALSTADNQVSLGNSSVTEVLAGSGLATIKAGAVQLTTKADPACSITTRGQFWFLAGGTGVKDTVNVCAKDAGNSYAWRVIY